MAGLRRVFTPWPSKWGATAGMSPVVTDRPEGLS